MNTTQENQAQRDSDIAKAKAEKKEKMAAIEQQQKELIAQAATVVATDLPKAMELCFHARFLEVEKGIIASAPIPKYWPGGGIVQGPFAMVGDGGPEVVITPGGKCYIPNTGIFYNDNGVAIQLEPRDCSRK